MDTVPSPDESTEEQVLTEISTIARRYARRIADPDGADDLAQEVMLHCLLRMRTGRWRIDVSLRAFVRAMVRKRRDMSYRLNQRRARRDAEHARERAESIHVWMSPDLIIQQRELDHFHAITLASLPTICRRTYMMVREQEVSYQVVADRMGRSRASVCSHVVAAQRRFRLKLLEEGIAMPPAPRGRAQSRPGRSSNLSGRTE
jgi:RNA polymerase sigma factor (sigma-70 family)